MLTGFDAKFLRNWIHGTDHRHERLRPLGTKRSSYRFFPLGNFGEAAISAVTAWELLVGVHRADSEARRQRRSAFVESVLTQIPIRDFTIEVARVHAELLATLTRSGQMIGAHDLMIAATARHDDCSVLTINVAEFERVPDLDVIQLQN